MSETHIFFDLDLVLVDVFSEWRKLCGAWGQELGRDPDEVLQDGRLIWMRGEAYRPEHHMKVIGLSDSRTAQQALDRFYAWIDTGSAVYPDVASFWNKHEAGPHRFSIVSFGDEVFQSRKARSLPIVLDCFASINIIPSTGMKARRMTERAKPGERLILVDDNGGEHKAAKGFAPSIVRVQMLRNQQVTRSEDAQYHIKDLGEFDDLLTRLHH